jgi:hypothetical protein
MALDWIHKIIKAQIYQMDGHKGLCEADESSRKEQAVVHHTHILNLHPMGDCMVSLGCHARELLTGSLKLQTFIFHNSGGWKSKIKVLAGLVFGEVSLPGLQMATFFTVFVMDSGQFRGHSVLGLIGERIQGRHRGDLSRSRFISAKQSKSAPSDGRVGRFKEENCAEGPKTSNFYWGSMDIGLSSFLETWFMCH